MKRWAVILAAFIGCIAITETSAQLIIAPTAVLVDNANKFASVMIINRSNEARDVILDFRFGYPQSDSLGNVVVNYADSLAANKYSLVSWVKAFPRQFTLAPGEQRTVRLTVKTPPDLAVGAYWARMVATSTPKAQIADTNTSSIGAQINFVFNQVIPVVYYNGSVDAKIAVSGTKAVAEKEQLSLISAIVCNGHSPFFGSASLRVLDAAGTTVEEQKMPLAVYFRLDKRFTLNRKLYKPGAYTAEVSVTGQRGDIDEKFLKNVQPAQERVTFSVKSAQ